MTSSALDSLAGLLEPVSASSPAGVDARLEPAHELLRREIAKLSAAEGGTPNWTLVASVGAELLGTRSKDLLVAVYLACALAVQEPILGAARGAGLLASLLLRFGVLLFPVRERARVSALEWYLEWLSAQLAVSTPSAPSAVSSLREQLTRLREAVVAVLGDAAPSFAAALRSCERLEQNTLVSDTAAPPLTSAGSRAGSRAAEPPTAGVSRVAPRLAASGRPAVVAAAAAPDLESARHVFGAPPAALPQLQTYAARVGALLVELARSRFAVERSDPRSYRWLRSGLWLRWEHAPVPNRRGRTAIDGPSPARQVELTRALKSACWDDVLGLSEQQLVHHPLWLDLNRHSALALEQLGDAYSGGRAHVVRETQALVARLPQLATLAFSDGTPFASSDTTRWLLPVTTRGLPPVTTRGLPPVTAAPPEVALSEPLRERLLCREPAALVEVDELLRSSHSSRSSFLLRLELAALLECAGQVLPAVQTYRGLERDLDTFQLERWEPELALRVLAALSRLASAQEGAVQSEADRVRARLAQLSATALL